MKDTGNEPTMVGRSLAVGDRVADRYELRARLGQGGMGTVWRVLDHDLDEEIALKVLISDGAWTSDAVTRFRREVKLARRITHPNVARTYDLGRHDGLFYLTMEFIAGASLFDRMHDAIPLTEALRIAADVCRGLSAAHAQGVVHRDLKPDNVMLAGERVAITDFGVARSEGDALATSGAIVGTPTYMAPEQLGARAIDGRADVYALGVVLFELLTRSLPFQGETPFATAAARLTTPPPDPRTLRGDIPEGVAKLVLDAMALRREDRPDAQTMTERLDALRGAGTVARPVTPSGFSSVDFGARVAEGRSLCIETLDAAGDLASLASDLTRAMRDALASEKALRIVNSGADLALGGEVRAAQGRVRIKLRLVATSGATVWASRVDGSLDDPFALEDNVVREVTDAVRVRIGARRGPVDSAARERWETARALISRFDPRSLQQGVAMLEALEHDQPGEPTVQSLLALATMNMWLQTGGRDAAMGARAEELALRAIDADANLVDAYFAVANVRSVFGDYRSALRALREALARAPSFAEAHAMLGKILCETGHVGEGLQRFDVARRLGHSTPLSESSAIRARALCGNAADARALFEQLRARGELRSYLPVLGEIATWFADRAMAGEVATMMDAARTGAAWDQSIPLLYAYAAGEDYRAMAEGLFYESAAAPQNAWHRALIQRHIACYFAPLGADDIVLRAVETAAVQPPFIDLLWLDRVPILAGVRSDPRYAAARAVTAARVAELSL